MNLSERLDAGMKRLEKQAEIEKQAKIEADKKVEAMKQEDKEYQSTKDLLRYVAAEHVRMWEAQHDIEDKTEFEKKDLAIKYLIEAMAKKKNDYNIY